MISRLCTKLSLPKMQRKSLLFSAVSLLLLLSNIHCAHSPVDTNFDGQWHACEVAPQKVEMCLGEDDVGKLKKLLDQCGAPQP